MRRMGCVCRREGAHRSTFCVGVDERAGACACGVGLTPNPPFPLQACSFTSGSRRSCRHTEVHTTPPSTPPVAVRRLAITVRGGTGWRIVFLINTYICKQHRHAQRVRSLHDCAQIENPQSSERSKRNASKSLPVIRSSKLERLYISGNEPDLLLSRLTDSHGYTKAVRVRAHYVYVWYLGSA